MAEFAPVEFVTDDADELASKLSSFFAPHHYRLGSGGTAVSAGFSLAGDADVSVLTHWRGVPAEVDPEPFGDCYVVATSQQGQGWIRAEREEVVCRPNVTLALSPSARYRMGFDARYRSHTVRIRRELLQGLNERWTGRGAELELDFALRPLDRYLSAQWGYAMAQLADDAHTAHLSPIAKARLTEYALALLIEGHPHTMRGDAKAGASATSTCVRDAAEYIRRNACDPITVAQVAAAVGCSVRSLQAGFRSCLGTTPREYLASVRMALARDQLSQPSPTTRVADVAMRLGFTHLGRFSSAFRKEFGEYPAQLLRRRRAAVPTSRPSARHSGESRNFRPGREEGRRGPRLAPG